MTDLRAAAETAVEQCLGLEADESCVIVTDDKRQPIGEALYDVASEITDATLLRYPPGDQHGEEPPSPVAAAMEDADVFLAPTTKSLSHTRARGAANDAGARGATLPGITEDVFTTGLDADYETIRQHCEDVLAQVEGADELHVTTPAGTDITFEPGAREWRDDTGIVHEDGDFSNLPAGEVFVSPEDANGTYVVDGTMMPHGKLDDDEQLRFEVADGFVTEISDDQVREQVEAASEQVGEDAYNLAELGIGTNVAVTELVGSVLLDEKAAGTVHIAIGDDAGIGGDTDAPLHLDGIIREPTVFADGEEVELPSP
ncbi:aminopeptidase (homolog to leucyl aminopeptidase / aminopeptidase T) [Halobacterium hubeiense]|uniref:Aminopeptidase (Homolog to leucyl aminopeptidase / aminopeptidase T) n=1 Tax=Halobacterium hubeiense TaxID=1407499 RepID=A0A0U5H232_9EURY|nr:aminopeptidase [Halobacterium hubeiense]CQH47072.1 aminopeptidase (homolog to leucyl aminopeptidase / aminopeptidase T) [Halobacterium hubeiense]